MALKRNRLRDLIEWRRALFPSVDTGFRHALQPQLCGSIEGQKKATQRAAFSFYALRPLDQALLNSDDHLIDGTGKARFYWTHTDVFGYRGLII